MKKKEAIQSIKAIDNELERLHSLLGLGDKAFNGEIYRRIRKLQDTLNEIARKHNGLDY